MLAIKTGENVNDGKIADVADVEAGAGGVGKHFGEEHFRGAGLLGSLESGSVCPDFLPFFFDFKRFVSIHFYIISYFGRFD